jgi:hypothetical protein
MKPKCAAAARTTATSYFGAVAAGRFWWTLNSGALAGFALAGCVTGPRPLDAREREAIYRRTDTVFSQATLFKPMESAVVSNLAAKLAPLFICDVASTNAVDVRNPSLREVSFFEGEVMVGGQAHPQVGFVWKQPGSKRQGVRLTLDAAGLPAIWEVWHPTSQANVFFVSQKLEAAARRQFGPPLPGRRFAVERSLPEAPSAVVARALDDAPVAMGPVVHLDGQGNITTVNCRCMATQARQLVVTADYELKPLSAATTAHREALGTNRRFAEMLRLPPAF